MLVSLTKIPANFDDEPVTLGELAYPLEPGSDRVAWIP